MTSGRGILFRVFAKSYSFSSAKIEERLQFHHSMGGWMPSSRKKGSSRTLGGRAAGGARLRTRKVTGRDASLPAPLLAASLELVGRGTVGALPQTPQGTLSLDPARGRRKGTKSPLDPFARLGWSHFHAPSACSFWWLRLSPCLLPQLSVKNLLIYLLRFGRCVPISRNAITPAAMPPYSLSSWLQPYPAITAFACRR